MMTKRIIEALYLIPAGKPITQYRIMYRSDYKGDGGYAGGIPMILKMLGGGRKHVCKS